MSSTSIPGYTLGTEQVSRSPLTADELDRLKRTALFEAEDERYLRMSFDVLRDQTAEIVETWYRFMESQPHLIATFAGPDGKPIPSYLEAVRKRFEQWILDTASARFDQAWLDYQHEIGLRHHRAKKNQTDGVEAAPIVPFRYMLPLIMPMMATLKPFLAKKGHGADDVERMHAAWTKSVLIQVTLWSWPYVQGGDF